MNEFNSKNLPFDAPGAGARNYGVSRENVANKFKKIWADRATEDGGSKQIYNHLLKWSSPESLSARGQNPNSEQWRLMREALQTGNVSPKLRPDLLLQGMDFGLRETARFQQHKPVNFFTEYLMDPLVQVGLGAIPGVGPGLAMAYGGIKGGIEDGLVGGLLGAASGYGAGKLGSGLGNALSNAGGVGTFMNAPGTFLNNLGRQGLTALDGGLANVQGFFQHPLQTLAGTAPSLTGTFSNVGGGLSNVPGAVNTAGTLGAAADRIGGGVATSTGGGIIDRVLNGTGGGILDTILRYGTPLVGANMASDAARDAARTQYAGSLAAIDEQRRQFDQNRADLAPYRQLGAGALGELEYQLGLGNRRGRDRGYLMDNFDLRDFQADPGYQFRRNEGLRAIENTGAARGMQLSGATLKALNRFNSDLASQEFGNAYNRDAANKQRRFNFLSGAAGTGQAAVNTGVNAGQNMAGNIGNYLTQGANAQAAGQVGSANAWAGGLQGITDTYSQQQLLNRLFPQAGSGNFGGNSLYTPRVP